MTAFAVGSGRGIALKFLEKLFRRQRQIFLSSRGESGTGRGNQSRADFRRLAVFFQLLLQRVDPLEISFNSSLAILLAADTLRTLMCASQVGLAQRCSDFFFPTFG